jgi:hypothetical protein
MTASYDGDVKICDIASMRSEILNGTAPGLEDAVFRVPSLPFNTNGCKITQTFNGKPPISDARWHHNDTIVVARKSGHISLINACGFIDPVSPKDSAADIVPLPQVKRWRCRVLGCGSDEHVLPEDHFYEFERRKLEWDSWGTAVDQVTKARTHEMPRGPLCNRHFESYEDFGLYAGVWEQAALAANVSAEQQNGFNGGADMQDDDDDAIFVQPLDAGAGRRQADTSSESGDLCVIHVPRSCDMRNADARVCRYDVSEDSEESDSSASLSSNDDWSEHSSGDDFNGRDRRRTTVPSTCFLS